MTDKQGPSAWRVALWRVRQATPWAWPPIMLVGASIGSWLHRGWGAVVGFGISTALVSGVVVLAVKLQVMNPWLSEAHEEPAESHPSP